MYFVNQQIFLDIFGNLKRGKLKVQKQPFADVLKISVTKNFANFTGKNI